jgi:hypothetical protein
MVVTRASSELGRKREGSMLGEDQGAGSAELRGERKSGGAEKESGLQETGKANMQGKDAGPDWREAIIRYLSSPSNERDKRVHQQALKYVVMDDELYRRTMDGMLLRCLGEEQSQLAMREVHEGLCSTEDEMGIKACRFLLANNDERLHGISTRLCSLPVVWEHPNDTC